MVTIKDIAEKAGVSRGTVDRVINNRGKVAPEKEALVLRIAQELGYQPNIAGKALAARKKKWKLGFCYLSSPRLPFHHVVYKGAKEYVSELEPYGIEVIFIPIETKDYDDTFWLDECLKNQQIDGWAIPGRLADLLFEEMKKRGHENIPIVVYGNDVAKYKRIAFVGCDYEQAGRLACGMAALMTKGNAHVSIISLDPGVESSHRRVQGFEREKEQNYPNMEIASVQYLDPQMDQFEIFMIAQQVVTLHPDTDIIYLVNPGDYSICQAIRKVSEERGIQIITNDLILESQKDMLKNGLIAAIINQQPEKMGKLSLEILFQFLVMGVKPEKDWYKTELSVLIRQSI